MSSDPSKPVPLDDAAVEAAAKAICEAGIDPEREPEERWDEFEDDSSLHIECRRDAQAAILAADEARGMRVDNKDSRGITTGKYRLVSRWFPIKGPVDE